MIRIELGKRTKFICTTAWRTVPSLQQCLGRALWILLTTTRRVHLHTILWLPYWPCHNTGIREGTEGYTHLQNAESYCRVWFLHTRFEPVNLQLVSRYFLDWVIQPPVSHLLSETDYFGSTTFKMRIILLLWIGYVALVIAFTLVTSPH